MMSIPTKDPPLKEIGCHLGHHLSPTIFKSEPGMLATSKDRGGNREMFTVAVRIQANHETHHVKVNHDAYYYYSIYRRMWVIKVRQN